MTSLHLTDIFVNVQMLISLLAIDRGEGDRLLEAHASNQGRYGSGRVPSMLTGRLEDNLSGMGLVDVR